MSRPIHTSGHTLIELLIVMGMFTILFAVSSFNLLGARSHTSLGTAVDTLLTDLRGQQTRAMNGDTNGSGSASDYGVHFLTNAYVLFKAPYSLSDPTNLTVSLADVAITTTFPSDEVVFTRGSGEVAGGGASIRLTGSTSSVGPMIISINRLGVIQSVN